MDEPKLRDWDKLPESKKGEIIGWMIGQALSSTWTETALATAAAGQFGIPFVPIDAAKAALAKADSLRQKPKDAKADSLATMSTAEFYAHLRESAEASREEETPRSAVDIDPEDLGEGQGVKM